ncbi:uncharacterized protein LOC111903410 [Lactuca sativa]|nr:uncharacterized protein LOC111903410 [Lactuca sativa]
MPPGVKEDDIGWKHGKKVEGTTNWVLCNYCPNVAKGGITRHKHHLAGDSTSVCKCIRAPLDVRKLFKDIFEKQKQDKVDRNRVPHFDDDVVDINDEDEEEVGEVPFSLGKRVNLSSKSTLHNKKVKGALDTHFRPSNETGKKKGYLVGTPEHNQLHKKLRGDAVQKFARWMYDAGLAFNAVKYDSLGPALEAIAIHGPGMKPPSYHEVRVPLLKLEKEHTKKLLILNETEKNAIGCSLMADGWRDRKGRALINFLVNTPRGSMFLESVDASSYSHTGENLFKLFDYFIKETGPDHVVQIVTDSVANNVLAGKMVEAKYPHIYWTPCAAHCIDLMLEDIFKVTHLKKTLDKAIAVNTYIYNRTLLLNMLRDFTGQRDMIRPAKTRFATALLTLNCFRSHKTSLKKLFTSEAWNKSRFKGEEGGTQCVTTIFSPSFWINIDIAVKVGEPLLAVLRLVDSERKPAMGYIYEAMDRAKEQIAYSFNNKFNKYKAFFKIIDDRWNYQLHQDLHAAGHYLNPSIFYNNPGVKEDSEVIKGLMACIHKMSSEEDETKIHQELSIYTGAEELFAQHMAIKLRTTLAPAKWWMQYGSSAPTLKKFVVKVLSLTCSSSGCERNWSVFEHIHSKKRNRLERQKLNDLVYIKYNRALRRRYDMRDMIDPIILEDSHIHDPFEWLASDDDGLVFEGDDLRWDVVAEAMGVDEPVHLTRRTTPGGRQGGMQGAVGVAESSSQGRARARQPHLIDEPEEENDVGVYKEFVEIVGEDELVFEENEDND